MWLTDAATPTRSRKNGVQGGFLAHIHLRNPNELAEVMTSERQQAWRVQDVEGKARQQKAWKMQEAASSLPGIGPVYRATSHPKRIIWMVIVLVSLFQTVRQSTEIITQYLQYPVTMSVSTTSSPFIKSPAVTICPAARLSCRRLASALLQELTDVGNQTTDSRSASTSVRDSHAAESLLLKLFAVTDCCKTLQRNLPVSDLLTLGCKPPGFNSFIPQHGRLVASHVVSQEYHELISKISFEEREKFFLQLNQTVVSCTLASQSCMGEIRRTPPKTLTSQGCFTIFGNPKTKMDISVPIPGSSSGITVLLRTDLYDYPSSGLAESSGFIVQVHSRTRPSNVNELGFLVSPGTVTRAAITIKREERMKAPYPSKCIGSWRETLFSPLKWNGETLVESNETYTLYECYSMCYQWFLITKCGCFNANFRVSFTFSHGNGTLSVYDMLPNLEQCREAERQCSDKYIEQVYTSANTNCPCELECRVTTFDLTLTTAAFPTPTFENNFYKTHNISKTIGVAVLQVFYSTLEKHLVAERPKYEDLATLVSNIGGIGGAYLGLSLIALTEFLDIISQAAMKMIF